MNEERELDREETQQKQQEEIAAWLCELREDIDHTGS